MDRECVCVTGRALDLIVHNHTSNPVEATTLNNELSSLEQLLMNKWKVTWQHKLLLLWILEVQVGEPVDGQDGYQRSL